MFGKLPWYTELSFYVCMVFVLFMLADVARRAAKKSGIPRVYLLAAGACLLLYLVLHGVLAVAGVYANVHSNMLPIVLIVPLPVFTLLLWVAFFRHGAFFRSLSLRRLTYLQTFRVLVETVLFYSALEHGLIPELMTFSGRNFDLLVGLTAPLVAWLVFERAVLGARFLLAWNVAGLALLGNIVTHAVLSLPTPVQRLAFEQPNVLVLEFPYIYLPVLLVMAALLGHVVSITRLLAAADLTPQRTPRYPADRPDSVR